MTHSTFVSFFWLRNVIQLDGVMRRWIFLCCYLKSNIKKRLENTHNRWEFTLESIAWTNDENLQTAHRHSVSQCFRPTTMSLPSTNHLPSILLRPLASVFVPSACFSLWLYLPSVSRPPFLPNLNLPPRRAIDLLSGRPGLVKKDEATRSNGA
jgi:hypothetical protein